MVRVDFGNHERHVGEHAVVPGVADDDVAGGGKGGLDVLGGAGVERREKHLRRPPGRARVDVHPEDVGRRRGREPPLHRLAVGAPLGALARPEPGRLEPRMAREKPHELLSDHAGGAKNADLELPHATAVHCTHFLFLKLEAVFPTPR